MKSEIQEKIVKGMPMFAPSDPEVVAREARELRELE